ncbi:uncharacterized protein LOC130723747 isoform X2 [Lotus japonicus]|uniref:uncharacterized protein LOC130723747 isoform X2 n=1 Tax=Lotus japonicus TaxID=34305 RepID=UPI0025849C08|nr:uncharacterized protein LOC130723747 isoform X2 [Lotus japonicus]
MGAGASARASVSPILTITASATTTEIPGGKVSDIFVYPIKSCRGISVSSAPFTPAGFRWDREWMVVNSRGKAISQRNEPKLALVHVDLPNEAFAEDWQAPEDSFMELKAPGMQPLKVCLGKQPELKNGFSVWEWTGSAWDEGSEASQWFSAFLGKPSQLVRFNTASEVRQVDPDYVKGHHPTLFTDGYPFLLSSQDSLNALNELLEEPININRFRANILVEGCEPFAEDLWSEIKIGRFSFLGSKMCGRCKITTTDQETAIVGREPLQTLMTFRSGKLIRPQDKKNRAMSYFGQYVVWNWNDSSAKGSGKVLKVGDPVYVLQKFSSPAEAPA